MKTTIKSGEIWSPQESASVEFCFKKIDTVTSETALRIIKLVESKKSKNTETTSSNTFDCFAEWYPISSVNRDKLIQFFQDKNNNELWRLILSKTWILTTEENKKFIDTFLYDSDWKADVSQFIEFVIWELENYPFVIDFEYDEIKEINIDDKRTDLQGKKVFKFKKDNKRWLIITSINWKKYILPEKYTKLEYKRNWTFCWIVNSEKSYKWEYIKLVWEEFIQIWTIDNIRDIPNLSDSEGNLTYNAIWWKKWLKKFENDNEWNRILNEKLKPEYDSIRIENWLVIASKASELDNSNWWKIEKEKNYEIFLQNGFKKILQYDDIKWYEYVKWIEDIKVIEFITSKWSCYFEIDNNWVVKAINYLQGFQSSKNWKSIPEIIRDFNLWKPVFIKYYKNINCFIVKWKDDQILSYKFNEWKTTIENDDIWLNKKKYLTYNINSETYIYDIDNNSLNISNKRYKKNWPREFDSIKKDLDKIPLNPFENEF